MSEADKGAVQYPVIKWRNKPDGTYYSERISHCYHDTNQMIARGMHTYGCSVCCMCGHVWQWHTDRETVPGHGKYFDVTEHVRVYDGESPPSCEEHEKNNAKQP